MSQASTIQPKPNPKSNFKHDRRPFFSSSCIAFAGIVVFGIVAGAAVVEFEVFPYNQVLAPSFEATKAIHRRIDTTSALEKTNLWYPSRFAQRGVIYHAPDKAYEGYTLYSSAHRAAAFLIDMNGEVVHRWHMPFYEVWPNPKHVTRPVQDRFIHWRKTQLLPNGDLIGLYEAFGDTPYGYGLVKIDRDSNLIWSYTDNTHHDFCVDSDDSILVLTHSFRDPSTAPVKGAPHLQETLLEDFIVRLSPDGEPLQKLSLVDAFADSEYHHLLTPARKEEWDILHTNSVAVATPEFAARHAFVEPGQVMISMRVRQALALVDMKAKEVVWARCGPYQCQHDPDLLDNGNIMLFDNQGHVGSTGPSRIIEFNPDTDEIVWQYHGDDENYFYTPVPSQQQQLGNGNVLITESSAGRVFEVTRDGQLVWEYRNPATLDGNALYLPMICAAQRFRPEELTFTPNGGVGPSATDMGVK